MDDRSNPVQTVLDEAQRAEATPAPTVNEVENCLIDLSQAARVPAFARTRNVKEQFQHAFELIGGIPRLALWAHQNPTPFYQLYSKLIPQSVNQKFDGTMRVELSWVDGRDTSGRSQAAVIDVTPEKT